MKVVRPMNLYRVRKTWLGKAENKMRSDNRDFWPSEAELRHYEKCSDGVITIETAKRLIRMIRFLQSQSPKP